MGKISVEKKKFLILLVGIFLLAFFLTKQHNEGKEKVNKKEKGIVSTTLESLTVPETIRVLIKNSNYSGIVHEKIEVVFEEKGTKKQNGQVENIATGQAISLTNESLSDTITLQGNKMKLTSINRGQGNPTYSAKLEIQNTEKGLILIQELPFETYLKGVVPSEMPAKYEKEALKAQAVCARTYAYSQVMSGYAYPDYKANLDDSVSFQVYLNQPRQQTSDEAVEETTGEILTQDQMPITAWYFSTSWGQTTDTDAWLTSDCAYLEAKKVADVATDVAVAAFKSGDSVEEVFRQSIDKVENGDFEVGEPWYRWSATIPVEKNVGQLWEKLVLCKKNNPERVLVKDKEAFVEGDIKEFKKIKSIEIRERGDGGLVNSLQIMTDKQTILVKGQYNIRQVLALESMEITKNDGTKAGSMQLLPSGFFYIKERDGDEVSTVELRGGGFGHGAGLSQNGANNMAKKGWKYDGILCFFYKDATISRLKQAL